MTVHTRAIFHPGFKAGRKVVRIPGVKTARLFSRWLKGRILGGALILGYHRIIQATEDTYNICVSPTHFSEQLEVLRKKANPIALPEFVQHLIQGTLPRKSVVLTFDDGYVDNFQNARGLLDQYQIPATVFVSTDYLGKEFWWDEISRLANNIPTRPRELQLTVQGKPIVWNLDKPVKIWNGPRGETDRTEWLKSLYLMLFPMDKDDREEVLFQLRQWAEGRDASIGQSRALTTDELLELAESELIDIGSHTATHQALTGMPLTQQRVEIQRSKTFLENLLGKPVEGLAYPDGKFSAETQAIVKEAGYLFACSSQKELARHSQQRYALPRLWPGDWDGDQFSRYISLWLG